MYYLYWWHAVVQLLEVLCYQPEGRHLVPTYDYTKSPDIASIYFILPGPTPQYSAYHSGYRPFEPSQNLRQTELYTAIYSVIQNDGLNFVRLYFLNYTWYVNDLHNI